MNTIPVILDVCDDFLFGKLATVQYTYHEPSRCYMGAYMPAKVTADAVVIGSGEYLDCLSDAEQDALGQRVLELLEEGWQTDEAEQAVADWEASATDHYLACTKGF